MRLPHGRVCDGAELPSTVRDVLARYARVVVKPDRAAAWPRAAVRRARRAPARARAAWAAGGSWRSTWRTPRRSAPSSRRRPRVRASGSTARCVRSTAPSLATTRPRRAPTPTGCAVNCTAGGGSWVTAWRGAGTSGRTTSTPSWPRTACCTRPSATCGGPRRPPRTRWSALPPRPRGHPAPAWIMATAAPGPSLTFAQALDRLRAGGLDYDAYRRRGRRPVRRPPGGGHRLALRGSGPRPAPPRGGGIPPLRCARLTRVLNRPQHAGLARAADSADRLRRVPLVRMVVATALGSRFRQTRLGLSAPRGQPGLRRRLRRGRRPVRPFRRIRRPTSRAGRVRRSPPGSRGLAARTPVRLGHTEVAPASPTGPWGRPLVLRGRGALGDRPGRRRRVRPQHSAVAGSGPRSGPGAARRLTGGLDRRVGAGAKPARACGCRPGPAELAGFTGTCHVRRSRQAHGRRPGPGLGRVREGRTGLRMRSAPTGVAGVEAVLPQGGSRRGAGAGGILRESGLRVGVRSRGCRGGGMP